MPLNSIVCRQHSGNRHTVIHFRREPITRFDETFHDGVFEAMSKISGRPIDIDAPNRISAATTFKHNSGLVVGLLGTRAEFRIGLDRLLIEVSTERPTSFVGDTLNSMSEHK